MTVFKIAALLASIINAGLVAVVCRQGLRAKFSKAYLLWGGGVALWNLGCVFLYDADEPGYALLWVKLLQLGIIIAPLGLYELCMLVADRKMPRASLYGFYALHTFFALSLFTDYFVEGVTRTDFGYWAIAGPLFYAYLLSYLYLTLVPFIFLFLRQRHTTGMNRTRSRALLVALGCIWIAGTNDMMPIVGMQNYPLFGWAFYPLGSVAAVVYVTIVGYASLQYQLLSVHVAMGRIAAHLIRFVFVILIGVCTFMLLSLFFPSTFSVAGLWATILSLGVGALGATLLFPRIFGGTDERLEQLLLGDRFEYHDRIREFTASLASYTDLNLLLKNVHDLFTQTIGVSSYSIVLIDETRRQFELLQSHPEQADSTSDVGEFDRNSPIFRYFSTSGARYIAASDTPPSSAPTETLEALQFLSFFKAEICFPFYFEKEPFGFLLLGGKVSGEPITPTDIKLLLAFSKSLALIINQMRLKNQILQVQELDLLGRMSRGMAHDLNNLLTPVHTFLQLTQEGVDGESLGDLTPVAIKNVATMRAYIREALFFSQNLRPDFQLGRLDVVLHSAMDLVNDRAQKRYITIVASNKQEVRLEIDSVLIERLVTNLLANAVDASPPGGEVRLDCKALPSVDGQREWWRISVADSGAGIAEEDLNRIFTPYFTTKQTGDESRGFGLGLAICRKIVHLHGGSLNVTSKKGRGTTVYVDLPTSQVNDSNSLPQGA